MALSSMTGFARSHGASGPYVFEWELKSVNAKGFDLRMRLPPGWDDLEATAKKRAGELLSRGTVYANLSVKRANAVSTIRINEDVLASIVRVAGELASRIDAVAPSRPSGSTRMCWRRSCGSRANSPHGSTRSRPASTAYSGSRA